MSYNYILNDEHNVSIDNEIILKPQDILLPINFCNNAIKMLDKQTKEFDINIFEVLGMRNLSGLVGEYFAKSVQIFSNNSLQSNLHQDGYPDLLLTNTIEKLDYFQSLYEENNGKKYLKDKSLFSPFKYGGIEIKATCGTTPPAKVIPKPLIGEQRINLINSFSWKAHHRETNNLLGIFWDFIDAIPTITACFYRNDLTIDNWGKIVKPKEDGGRTTSISIMTSKGVSKMCHGWIAVIDKEEYISTFAKTKWIGKRVI